MLNAGVEEFIAKERAPQEKHAHQHRKDPMRSRPFNGTHPIRWVPSALTGAPLAGGSFLRGTGCGAKTCHTLNGSASLSRLIS